MAQSLMSRCQPLRLIYMPPCQLYLDCQCVPNCHCRLTAFPVFLGDMFGYRRIYKCGLVVFLLSSLFCALSDSLQMLTLARIAQGFGGAALMSVNTALIRLIYPQRHLGRGMGINSFIVAVSSAAGPTIAAAILSISSWKWLFLINVPLGIIALILAIRFLPANIAHDTKPRFDLPSAVMNALTFGLLITALSGFARGQSLTLIGAELLVLVVVGFFFVRRQLSLPVPLLPIDLLRIPLFHSRSARQFARSARKC